MSGPERTRAHQLVASLSVVTQGRTRNYSPQPGVGDGPLFPPSGFDRRDDKEAEWKLKSHRHFVVRLKGCKTENDFGRVADDAQKALDAWKKTPHPPTDSDPWKEKVARTAGPIREVARQFNIDPKYVYQLRERYWFAA